MLLHDKPARVGIQRDGNYAVYYHYEKSRAIKIIISFNIPLISVITFYIIDGSQVPK